MSPSGDARTDELRLNSQGEKWLTIKVIDFEISQQFVILLSFLEKKQFRKIVSRDKIFF